MTDRLHSWREQLASEKAMTARKRRTAVGARKKGVEKDGGNLERDETPSPEGDSWAAQKH